MKIEFVPQDLWVGLHWKRQWQAYPRTGVSTTWHLCLVPCLPLIWTTFRPINLGREQGKGKH